MHHIVFIQIFQKNGQFTIFWTSHFHQHLNLKLGPCKTGKFSLRPYRNDYRN